MDSQSDNLAHLPVAAASDISVRTNWSCPSLPDEAEAILVRTAEIGWLAKALDHLKLQSPETVEHVRRVARCALALAWLNRSGDVRLDLGDLESLALATLAHDLGKADPRLRELVHTKGAFTAEQQAAMRRHIVIGRDFVRRYASNKLAESLVYLHHQFQDDPYLTESEVQDYIDSQNFDPATLRKLQVLREIIETADKFDALGSARSYKRSLDPEKVSREIKRKFAGRAGTKYADQLMALH